MNVAIEMLVSSLNESPYFSAMYDSPLAIVVINPLLKLSFKANFLSNFLGKLSPPILFYFLKNTTK